MAISSSTLKKDLLEKLARGIATTKILPVTNGEVTMTALDFSSAGQIFSIEDSFDLNWAEPSIDELRIDQGQQTIAIDVDRGDVTFAANYPTSASEAIAELFNISESDCVITAESGVSYTGKGVFLEPKTTEVSLLVEDQSKAYSVTFARIALTARYAYDQDRKVWYIGLNGRALMNLKSGQPDIVIAPRTAQ